MTRQRLRMTLGVLFAVLVAGTTMFACGLTRGVGRTDIVAFFDNSNGVFVGDDVLIRGVPVGRIDRIEPQPDRVKISFWVDKSYKIPKDVMAVVLSPTLVTARSIQLTPPYAGGPQLQNNAVIPQERTAVPVEWDQFRVQLEKLTQMLQPTQPGGVSTLGEFVSTVADNLRGRGPEIHHAIVQLAQALSALGDHSDDTFTTVRQLATLVTALQGSTDLMQQLNVNFAAVTALLANDPNEVGNAVKDFNDAVIDVRDFISENKEGLGTTSDKLASITTVLNDSQDDIKQLLHLAPTALSNNNNTYQPAQGTISGNAALNMFRDPISFLCGAVQAASRLGAEQSAKLCVQYLAPIIKNRQLNFPPIGMNPIVGPAARPNEITYSEDWMRPDFVPPQLGPAPAAPVNQPLAAEQPVPSAPAQPTDPQLGLPGMMMPSNAPGPDSEPNAAPPAMSAPR